MSLKKIIIFILSIGLIGLIYYRVQQQKSLRQTNGTVRTAVNVQAIIANFEPFKQTVEINGTVEANEQIDVQTEIAGVITRLNFEEGNYVKKGQILVQLQDAEWRAMRNQAKTRAQLAKDNFDRAEKLFAREAISREEFETALAEFQAAAAQVEFAEAQLLKTSIRAPFDGVVGLRNISNGAYVTPGTLITKLVDMSKVKITFSIPERHATVWDNSGLIEFYSKAQNKSGVANIMASDAGIETQNRTLQVRAIADNKDKSWLPGSFVTVLLPLQELAETVRVPTEAIIPIQNGKKMFVAKNGVAQDVKVEAITRTNADAIITNGLQKGDTVIVGGVMSLRNGTPLQIQIRK